MPAWQLSVNKKKQHMHNIVLSHPDLRSLSANCNDFVKVREDRSYCMNEYMAQKTTRECERDFVHRPWLKLKKLLQFTFSLSGSE